MVKVVQNRLGELMYVLKDGPDMRLKKWHMVVCGREPREGGKIHEEHQAALRNALDVYLLLKDEECFDGGKKVVIILTGGPTKGDISEAALAYHYMQEIAGTQGIDLPEVILEEDSRSTEENIKFAKNKSAAKGYVVSRLYIFARESQCPKVRAMAFKFWKPEHENVLQDERIVVVPGLDVALPWLLRWLDAKVGPIVWDNTLWKKTRSWRPH
jgi:hypothetical protein